MEKFKLTGGARIGMANVTWSFATLRVSKNKLELNASIAGKLVFQPKDVISIDAYNTIPLLGQEIKINHRIANYSKRVIFWTCKDPSTVVNQIRQTGFLENTTGEISDTDALIVQQQQTGLFPIKKSIAIGIIVLWNILLISDIIKFSTSDKKGMLFGNGTIIVLAMLFSISVLSLISKDFSKLILKEGKSIKDINKFLYFLIFMSGVMLLVILTFKNV